ncbi:MAG: 1,4-alpha-glucan branching protein GlgB [Oscillospiraceae bacterium]|nr:1,4-alpha-glucan branching protein GlgB [Oscillospiraceae bacterium]
MNKQTPENTAPTNPYLDSFSLYLYNEGKSFNCYDFLGAHKTDLFGIPGYSFAVWAPNAEAVSVVGDFNGWDTEASYMFPQGDTGIWHIFIKDAEDGQNYKYCIRTKAGELLYKADPCGYRCQLRPETASVTYDINGFEWTDNKWIEKKLTTAPYDKPMLIYEMHAGSWKQHEDGSFYNFRELADELAPYLADMGYTHLELMPISEYPFDGSWGYQVTGYFAVTARYGEPKDFMYFVNKLHDAGIAVILDWVPAHFPRDAHGLRLFDGTPAYEYADPRLGEHKEWGTLVFDYGKNQVISFLISSAMFWLDKYHIDGIRVDAVSSMLYLDYSRTEWVRNKYGKNENLEAIKFLRNLNKTVFRRFPNTLMIAEESTAWPLVTKPAHEGGLGFNYKWNMGWMNDMLRYMAMDPFFRRGNHSILTFSMMYAFSENYILPFSHDEVVHGKASLIGKMSGLEGQKFDSLRTLMMYKMAHPGKKLDFMGSELAQFLEWRFYEGLEWHLLELPAHNQYHKFIRELNHFYLNNKAFYEIENSWDGFQWINANDADRSVISFIRRGKAARDEVVVICNFTPVEYTKYRVGVPKRGDYKEMFSSAWAEFGGNDQRIGVVRSYKKPIDNMEYSIDVDLPPMSAIYLKRTTPEKKQKTNRKDDIV